MPTPPKRYRGAPRLGRQWSTYDETITGLPLGALTAEGQAAVLALAAEVAAHARGVVAAVQSLGDG